MGLEKKIKKYEKMNIKNFISQKKLSKILDIAQNIGKKDLMKSSDEIESIMNDAGYKTIGTGTNRLVFIHPDYDDLVFKVSFDHHGCEANEREYADRDLSKYLVYSYMISDNSVFLVQEKVKTLTYSISKEREDDIRDMLKHISKKLLLCDCKVSNFRNFGLRKDGSLCLLDHGDAIPLASDTEVINPDEDYNVSLRCKYVKNDDDPKNMIRCNGKLKYDKETYATLICEKCGKIISVPDAAKEFYGDIRNGGLSKSKSSISKEIAEFEERYKGAFLEKDEYEKKKEKIKEYAKEECEIYGNYMIPKQLLDDPQNAILKFGLLRGTISPKEFLNSSLKCNDLEEENNEREQRRIEMDNIKKLINGEPCVLCGKFFIPTRIANNPSKQMELMSIKRGNEEAFDKFCVKYNLNKDQYVFTQNDEKVQTKKINNKKEEKEMDKRSFDVALTEDEKEMIKYVQKQIDKHKDDYIYEIDLADILSKDTQKRYPIDLTKFEQGDNYLRSKLFKIITNKNNIHDLGFISTRNTPDKYVIKNTWNAPTDDKAVDSQIENIVMSAKEDIESHLEEDDDDKIVNDSSIANEEDKDIIDKNETNDDIPETNAELVGNEEDSNDIEDSNEEDADNENYIIMINGEECFETKKYYVPVALIDLIIDEDGNEADPSQVKSTLKKYNLKPKEYRIDDDDKDENLSNTEIVVDENDPGYEISDEMFVKFCNNFVSNIAMSKNKFYLYAESVLKDCKDEDLSISLDDNLLIVDKLSNYEVSIDLRSFEIPEQMVCECFNKLKESNFEVEVDDAVRDIINYKNDVYYTIKYNNDCIAFNASAAFIGNEALDTLKNIYHNDGFFCFGTKGEGSDKLNYIIGILRESASNISKIDGCSSNEFGVVFNCFNKSFKQFISAFVNFVMSDIDECIKCCNPINITTADIRHKLVMFINKNINGNLINNVLISYCRYTVSIDELLKIYRSEEISDMDAKFLEYYDINNELPIVEYIESILTDNDNSESDDSEEDDDEDEQEEDEPETEEDQAPVTINLNIVKTIDVIYNGKIIRIDEEVFNELYEN